MSPVQTNFLKCLPKVHLQIPLSRADRWKQGKVGEGVGDSQGRNHPLSSQEFTQHGRPSPTVTVGHHVQLSVKSPLLESRAPLLWSHLGVTSQKPEGSPPPQPPTSGLCEVSRGQDRKTPSKGPCGPLILCLQLHHSRAQGHISSSDFLCWLTPLLTAVK
jgi:hypothetical protein